MGAGGSEQMFGLRNYARPTAQLRLMSVRELLRQPAKTYSLQLKRGAETVSVELETRRLI